MGARLAAWFLVLGLLSPVAFSQIPTQLGTVSNQAIYAPFWSTEPGWSTHLEVRNSKTNDTLIVTPALRQFSGREVALTSRTIAPNDYVEIDVAQELATAAPELINQTGSYGAVVFRFSGTQARNIYADSMVSMPGHPIAFHFDAIMQDAAFSAGSQESVWWLPLTTTSDFIIISNSGSAGISGTLELYDATGRLSSSAVSIPASQASRIDVGALVRAASFTGTMGGLRLTLPQSGGVVQVAHLLFDETVGYSAILRAFDRGAPTDIANRQYIAAMVALSQPDSALSLPAGTTLTPELIVRNTSSNVLTASLNAGWHNGTTWGNANLGQISLNPNEQGLSAWRSTSRAGLYLRQHHGLLSPSVTQVREAIL